MASKFWDNTRNRLNNLEKTQKWLANASKIGKTVINSGIARSSSPTVDNAYYISKALNISIEELVDGEAGEQYLREYIQEKGWAFSPPPRIDEQGLLAAYRKLNDEGKKAAVAAVSGLQSAFPLVSAEAGLSS